MLFTYFPIFLNHKDFLIPKNDYFDELKLEYKVVYGKPKEH